MKKLFVILLFIYGTAYGQTVKVATSTATTAPVVYTTAGTDAAIAKVFNGLPTLDTSTYAKLRNGKIMILQDAAIPILQSQAITLQTSLNSQIIALQTQDKAAAVQIATLQAQTTSQQVQLNAQQAVIDKLTSQVMALQVVIDKLKIALQ